MNKLTEQERLQRSIDLLESDLRDSRDPKIVKKYPHLGSKSHVEQIEKRLAVMKALLPGPGK